MSAAEKYGSAESFKLTPEQQKAVQDVIAQVQQQLTEMGNKAAKDVKKTADDLKKSMPGQ